jgi:MT0933-like antitoxin protein
MTDKTQRDYAADAKAAIEKLRAYAAGHSDDITGAIDKLGDFVDKGTKGKYGDKLDKAQETVKKRVTETLRTPTGPEHAGEATDPFSLDDEPQWKQPPGTTGAHAFTDPAAKAPGPDVKAALAKLRSFAAAHTDDLSGLVDKVGDFVDKQTQGKYAEKIDKAQTAAKSQIGKLK